MEVPINRQVLNAILVGHGAGRERVKGLRIKTIEEPHLVPKDRIIIIRALKRFAALFRFPLGVHVPGEEETLLIYKTRIELSLYSLDIVLAHECGHFLDNNLKRKSLLGILPSHIAFCKDLCRDWTTNKEWIVSEVARVLREDPRWEQVISSDS